MSDITTRDFSREAREAPLQLKGPARLRTLKDVVDWGMCVGCGACAYLCDRDPPEIVDVPNIGERPRFNVSCGDCRECLSVCPGYQVDVRVQRSETPVLRHPVIGAYLEIWEGCATDGEIRRAASSGGAVSALALYCLERENMAFVLHSGMNPNVPMSNVTVQSRKRDELLARAGSRYSPASPCEGLGCIEMSDRPCVFIGKPCDAAAATMARRRRPRLDANLGLVLSFFCAGTPSTRGSELLLRQLGVDDSELRELRYRGNGWPGHFAAVFGSERRRVALSYEDSWRFLQAHRPFRCHLCPDGMGELSDIACGDAWHRFGDDGNDGCSLLIVRTERGRRILHAARAAGYLDLKQSDVNCVVKAEAGLVRKRTWLFGRLAAMKMAGVPVTSFKGFGLFESWRSLSATAKMRTVLGTLRRILQKGLYRRRPIQFPAGSE